MKILDQNDVEITSPDLNLGYLKDDKVFVQHHEAVEAVAEIWHHEVVAEYPNGGKDVRKVIDVPGVAAAEAWDEYEDIQRYVLYTEEELAAMEAERNRPTTEERLEALELAFLEMMGVNVDG